VFILQLRRAKLTKGWHDVQRQGPKLRIAREMIASHDRIQLCYNEISSPRRISILKKKIKMSITSGLLHARLTANDSVETWIESADGSVLRPILTKNIDTAEVDFVRFYGLAPEDAAAFRARLERDGSANTPVIT
jgi:hypothetical protein